MTVSEFFPSLKHVLKCFVIIAQYFFNAIYFLKFSLFFDNFLMLFITGGFTFDKKIFLFLLSTTQFMRYGYKKGFQKTSQRSRLAALYKHIPGTSDGQKNDGVAVALTICDR